MAQHAVIADNVSDGAAWKANTGPKRRVDVIIGVARDGGVVELNANAVPGIDAVIAVACNAGAHILIGLHKGVVVSRNPMTRVARDGGVVDMNGTVVRRRDTVTSVVFYSTRIKFSHAIGTNLNPSISFIARDNGGGEVDITAAPNADTLVGIVLYLQRHF